MIKTAHVRDLLAMERFEEFIQQKAVGAYAGVAADADASDDGDWAHKNPVALYLSWALHIPGVCADYVGVTVVGEGDELLFDESTRWVERLLRLLDATFAGMNAPGEVFREQVLAFLSFLKEEDALHHAASLPEDPAGEAVAYPDHLLVALEYAYEQVAIELDPVNNFTLLDASKSDGLDVLEGVIVGVLGDERLPPEDRAPWRDFLRAVASVKAAWTSGQQAFDARVDGPGEQWQREGLGDACVQAEEVAIQLVGEHFPSFEQQYWFVAGWMCRFFDGCGPA